MVQVDFRALAERFGAPKEFCDMGPDAIIRRSEENKVAAYNSMVPPDDGTGVKCEECQGRGYVAFVSDKTGRCTIRECKCRGTRLTVQRLKKAGIWEQARRYRLDSFKTDTPFRRTMKETVERFIQEPGGHWLALCGQSGAGKSHLCTAVFVELSHRYGMAGQYFLWNRDGRALKAATMEDAAGLWDKYKTAELLYLDDVFKDAQGDADKRLSFELLDYRYNNGLVTIISSELTIDRMMALDQAIAGRIKERCGPYLLNIAPDPAKNYRLTGASGRF